MSWLIWFLLPAIGACIGYVTNWVAIKMLFHPRQRRLGMQGLIPRRQNELALKIGKVVGADIIHLDKMAEPLKDADLKPLLDELIDTALQSKVAEWQQIPLVGAFITEERVASIRDGIIDEIINNQPAMIDRMTEFAAAHIDISKIASDNVANFDLDRLEDLVHHIARTEFRAIEAWGAVLGCLIGLVQVALLYIIGNGAGL